MKTVLSTIVGSRAYNTDVEGSDVDWLEVNLYNKEHYLGIKTSTESWMSAENHSGYELRNFVMMCMKGNPNIIPALFVHPNYIDPAFQPIFDIKQAFLSKNIINSFKGYATGQRINGGLTNDGKTGKMGAARKELRDKYGYDTKFAMHSVRLCDTLIDFLNDPSTLKVYRAEGDFLRQVRNGFFSRQEIVSILDDKEQEINELIPLSNAPTLPDIELINKTTISAMENLLDY